MPRKVLSLLVLPFLALPSVAESQSVQAGIFNPSGNTISVKAKRTGTLPNDNLSAVNVTVRWLTSYGVTLGSLTTNYQISLFETGTDGLYTYSVYLSVPVPNIAITWVSDETELFQVQASGGSGPATFELTSQPSGTADWYFEVGGIDVTNPTFYQPTTELPLPVQLANFTVTAPKQNQVRLDWTTLTETNNYGFEVQKSGDGKSYQTISNSFIPGHGTTLQPHTYSYTDAAAGSEQIYYRLKQIDLDGAVHFSEGQQLNSLTSIKEKPLPTEFALDQNYPNPFNPSTMIEFALPKETRVTLEVYNILGQRVSTLVDESRPAGYYIVSFDAKGLASGLYFYRMSTDEVSFLKKMVVMK